VTSSLDPSAVLPERLQPKLESARAALREPFVGLTEAGRPRSGLFSIRRTGISLEPVATAAQAFYDVLSHEQQVKALFEIESDAWRAWHNIHPNLMRHGVCLADLNAAQRDRALCLLRESMSAGGFDLASDIMRLNEHLGQISVRPAEFGEWYYWMSLMSLPSPTQPWGWQLDGHHLSLNCFVLGDQIVLTPAFMGSEPVVAETAPYAGTRVFEHEESAGLRLMGSLTPEQQVRATIGTRLPIDVFGSAASDNLVLPFEGIPYSDLTSAQQASLITVIELYVGRIRPGHAEIKLEEVRAHLSETWFAWIGSSEPDGPFYYRVHSPVILIEFDHQPGTVYDNVEPSRNHIHTLVRTPNGNDYGKDLLRAHYEQFDHTNPDSPHRRCKE
jgi:hypothetical protein